MSIAIIINAGLSALVLVGIIGLTAWSILTQAHDWPNAAAPGMPVLRRPAWALRRPVAHGALTQSRY